MAFDGRDYQNPELAWVRNAQPGAPATGVVPAIALETAYYQARHGAKLLASMGAAYNESQWNRYSIRGMMPQRAAWREVFDSLIDIPASATHIVAAVSFAAYSYQEAEVRHRIGVDGTSGSDDVGDAAIIQINPSDTASQGGDPDDWEGQQAIGRAKLLGPGVRASNTVWIEVALSNQSHSDSSTNRLNARVYIEAYIYTPSSTGVAYRPGFCWIGYEVRDG